MSANVYYEVLEPHDAEEALKCSVSAVIAGEPTTKAVKGDQADFHYMMTVFAQVIVNEGLSIVAKDQQSHQIVGCAICKDFLAFPKQGFEQISQALLSSFSIFEKLEGDYKKEYSIKPGELFQLLILGVLEPFRLSNIGTQLVLEAERQAQKRHFKGITATLSSPISQHIFLNKLGYKEVSSILYQDFEYQGQKIFTSITECESCKLSIKKF